MTHAYQEAKRSPITFKLKFKYLSKDELLQLIKNAFMTTQGDMSHYHRYSKGVWKC